MYRITYVDHRYDLQEVTCSAYEDAERIAQFIADMYGSSEMIDGSITLTWTKKETHGHKQN